MDMELDVKVKDINLEGDDLWIKSNGTKGEYFLHISCLSICYSNCVQYFDKVILLLNIKAKGISWSYQGLLGHMTHFQSPLFENMMVVLNNKRYQKIELFILLQLMQVLTPGSNLIIFYDDKRR